MSQTTRHQTRLNLLYRDLVEGDRGTARAAARELAAASGLGINSAVTCILVEHLGSSENLATQARREGVICLSETDSTTALIVRGAIQPALFSAPELLEQFGYLRRLEAIGQSARVGVGPRVTSLEEVPRARWGALTALRVARAGAPGQVVHWESLGILKLLSAAADQDLAAALFTDGLRAFLNDERAAELVRTARIYLDAAGSIAQTAALLNIHRQTLYHRLEQVQRKIGLDLKVGAERSYLHVALMLADYVDTVTE